MYIANQSFLVLGLSKSGKSAAEFLLSNHARVYIYDDLMCDRVEQISVVLQEKGAIRVPKDNIAKAIELCDALVLSPGVPIDHPISVAFKKSGKAVLGETELAARMVRCPVIAVTGTNGKTTTVSMIENVLKQGGKTVYSCGNIGNPMIEHAFANLHDVAVAEISSFQLETLNSLCPHIAVVLNVTEDHLNRHYNMDNYVFLKAKLLKNCTETEFVVLNYDDPIVCRFAERTKARVIYFSVRERVNGAFYENGGLYFGKERIMSIDELPVGGLHNTQNALAVIAVAKIMGIKTAAIVAALTNFQGIPHRIEKVAEINGVTYIDDSKGTNVDATIKAVAAMEKETVILLGGKNKGYNYEKLFSALLNSKVTHAVLYGENRFSLLKSAQECGFLSVTLCDKFEFAVRIAALKATENQTVLLSPASASFDEFTGYEERGEKFAAIVHSFQNASTSLKEENSNVKNEEEALDVNTVEKNSEQKESESDEGEKHTTEGIGEEAVDVVSVEMEKVLEKKWEDEETE